LKLAGAILLGLVVLVAALAPWLAPNRPDQRFDDLLYAPPTPIRVLSANGTTAPFIYEQTIISRLERRFEEDRTSTVPLRWFTADALVTADPEGGAPLLLLGADGYGRDVFSRLVHGARITLALAAVSAFAAVLLGALAGGVAGLSGGRLDDLVSRVSELVLVLPTIYIVLALRGAMPLVMSASAIFLLLTSIFALLGWPVVARGVRAIVAAERNREYAEAAHAMGVSRTRLLFVHLLPAAFGHIAVQLTLLVPAFILAEATMSYVGLGFPDTTPTWGTMLQEAANVAMLGDTPWTLAPAVAIFVVVLAVNLIVQGRERA
jgi:peptide/nickel transport system permease protein